VPGQVIPPPITRVVCSREDQQRAWARRRADLREIAGVAEVLDLIDARVKELQQRTAAVLAAETDHERLLKGALTMSYVWFPGWFLGEYPSVPARLGGLSRALDAG